MEMAPSERIVMNTLVFNVGSSSVKFAFFERHHKNGVSGNFDLHEVEDDTEAIFEQIRSLVGDAPVDRIGHRLVHGGPDHNAPKLVDRDVRNELEQLAELAPLHQPKALRVIDLASKAFPGVPNYAAFDTAFFHELPEESQIYPVPYEWHQLYGIRRYGFHGLSHQYCWGELRKLCGPSANHTIIAHLGSGCSLTAIQDGRPISTTMGYTPLDGAMMATRSGSIDPGILLRLLKTGAMSLEEIEDELQNQSGLLGVSGKSADIRKLLIAEAEGDHRSALAINLFCESIREHIASLAVRMGTLDHLVFTGGIGTNSAEIRERILKNLEILGCALNSDKNQIATPGSRISSSESAVAIHTLHTNEEQQISHLITQAFDS